jgi:hypothetical protein
MYQTDITGTLEQANFLFPPAWVRGALVLAPLSIWVVITLFAHPPPTPSSGEAA